MMTELNQRLSQLKAYLTADPANPHLLLELADLHLQAGSQDEYEATLQRLFAAAPGHFGGRSLHGVGLMQQGRLDEAAAAFQALRDDGWEEPALFYNLAYVLMLQGRYEEAEPQAAIAAKRLELLPQAGPLHVRALHFLGRLEEAVLAAESALQQYPGHLVWYGLLATLYLDQENLAAAERVARQVLELSPSDPDAATVLGMLALSKQDLSVARPLLRQACVSKPNSGRAQMGLGLISMLDGQLDEAESRVVLALRAMPGHIGSWHVLAWCRILSHRPLEAKEALQEALRLDRNFADTHGGLAIVEIMEGRLQEAQQSVRRALGLNAGSFPAQYAQSLLLQSAGQAEQARAIHDRLLNSEVLPDGTKLNEALARAMALSSF